MAYDFPALAVRALSLGWALALVAVVSGCERPGADTPMLVRGGDPSRGPDLVRHYGCATCHTIPGVPSATGKIGPPLKGLRERAFIAGVLSNDGENLVRWIRDPRAIDPRTAMPYTGVDERDARDIAAFLYTR